MRKFRLGLFILGLFLVPNLSQAYIGAGLGVVDEDKFGFGLVFGFGLPFNLGIDAQVVSFINTGTTTQLGPADEYWIQGNADLSYDFNWAWKKVTDVVKLHPYIKGGFTYGGGVVKGSAFDSEATYGPGFNIGGGLDWKILFFSIGFDITQSFIWLNPITVDTPVGPEQLGEDGMSTVFNFLGTVKFFVY